MRISDWSSDVCSSDLRTATNVRTIFSKNGGNLGASGSVSHAFDRLGLITYPAKNGDADKVFEAALEAGAEDVSSSEEEHEIWTAQDDQIGRESCRERVWQYGSSTVVAVQLKKNKEKE